MKRVRICPQCDETWTTETYSNAEDELCDECSSERIDEQAAQEAMEELE